MSEEKLERAKRAISDYQGVVVAFSGGLDSSLLLALCADVLGRDRVAAVIGRSPTYPAREEKRAIAFCESLGVEYHIVDTDE